MPAESTILVLGVTDFRLRALLSDKIGVCGARAQFDPPGEISAVSAVVLLSGDNATEQVRKHRSVYDCALIAITEDPRFTHAQALLDAGADDVVSTSQLERLPVSLAAAIKATTACSGHEQRYTLQKAVNDHSPTEVFVKDLDGRYVYVNETTANRYAQLASDIVGKRAEDVFPPQQAAEIAEHDRKVLASGQVVTRTIEHADQYLHVTKFPIYDRNKIVGIGAIAVDVSEQQTALQALRSSEARLQDYAELAADIFYETGPDWLLTRCDGRFQEITGLAAESVIATLRPEVTRQDSARHPEKWRKLNEKLKRHEAVSGFELEWTRHDGRKICLLNNIKPMFDENRRFIGYRGAALDVTALRDTQKALREEERHLRFVVENASDFVTVLDEHGLIRYQSPSFALQTGYAVGDRIGKSPLEFVHLDDRDDVRAALDELLGKADCTKTLVYRFEARRDDWRHIESRFRSVVGESGALEIIVNSRDVSKRVAAETALRETETALRANEERFRSLIENASDLITVLDEAGLIRFQSPSVTRVLGYDTEEMLGHSPLDYIHADDRAHASNCMQKLLSRAGNTESVVIRQRHKDGDWRHFEAHGRSAMRGGALEIILNSREITDRVQAQTALRDSEELLQGVMDHSPNEVFIMGLDKRFVYINKRCEQLLGITNEHARGKRPGDIFPSHTAQFMEDHVQQVIDTQRTVIQQAEVPYVDGNHSVIIAEFPIRDAAGELVSIGAVATDITQGSSAARALQVSEERFRNLVEGSLQGILIHDLKDVLFVNQALQDIFGYSTLEEIRAAYTERRMIAAQDWERIAGYAKSSLAGKDSPQRFEFEAIRADGSLMHVEASERRINWQGRPALQATVLDITERKRAEQALRQSQAQLRALTMLAPAGIFRTDEQGQTTYVNEHWSELTGIATSQPRGDDWTYYLHEEDRDRVLKHWRDRLTSRTVFRDEYRYQRPHRSLVWVYCVANPQYDERGQFIGFIGALTNITARKQAQAELENYRDHLEELVDARTAELRAAVREQESFSYSVSHDLRSPLRTIDGFSHMLLDEYGDVLDAEGQRCLRRVREASQRMGLLIDALLNLSRTSRRKMRFEEVDLSDIASDILRRLQRTDPGRDAHFDIAAHLSARGDPALLRVVLENLLSNAWKYSNRRAHTHIKFDRINGLGSGFMVRDNGVGFDMRYADKLFKPFQRLHTFEEFEGTGIGLATVVRIIERHGGKVWAESEEGKGATFYFTV